MKNIYIPLKRLHLLISYRFNSGFTLWNPLKGVRSNSTGFTIIELLLAISLFLLVSMSLFFSMRSGLQLYKRSDEGLATTHEIMFLLNTLTHELRNSFRYSSVPFKGDERTLTFPSVLLTYDKDEVFTDIYKIEYNFKSRTLTKEKHSLSRNKDKKVTQKILHPLLKDMSFCFGFFDENEKIVVWKDEWPLEFEGMFPQAIKVNLIVTFFDKDMKRGIDKKIERKIWIPHGEWGSEELL